MTARRNRGAAAARALRGIARAWLHAHRDAHAETAWLWRYGPAGPAAPPRNPPAPGRAAGEARER